MPSNCVYSRLVFPLIILFVFTVSVEKIDLKGLSHTKNDRSVECSFEVRCVSPLLGGVLEAHVLLHVSQ